MANVYKSLTDFIPYLTDIEFGTWEPKVQSGDGSLEKPLQMPYMVFDEVVKILYEKYIVLKKIIRSMDCISTERYLSKMASIGGWILWRRQRRHSWMVSALWL